jgi:glycosyltransferase involved in cell wall biosynthesis
MKIGIESQRIFRKGKHGMDVVALELIRQIQQLDKENEYLLFAREGEDRDCIQDTQNFNTVMLNGYTYAGWEQVALPGAIKKYKPDVLHCTANTAPYSCDVPLILTVHDVIYLEEINFGGSAYQNAGNIYRKLVVPHAIKKAEKIITVSEYEKTVITEVCGTNPEKIVVIHNGVSERFSQHFDSLQLEKFKRQYELPEHFFLFLGNTAPKKNTVGVVKAYVQYCSMTNDPVPLVITDFPRQTIITMLEKLRRADVIGLVITPGYIPSLQMPLMYNCSNLFLYPSLRESFGLPVLEAMSCGVPVITSDIPAIREVAGDAAILANPGDPQRIAENLYSLSKDIQKRNVLIQKGLARTASFSWKNAAMKVMELYRLFE